MREEKPMKIVAWGGWQQEELLRHRLIHKYIREHREALNQLSGIKYWLARWRLEVAAWKYANDEMKKRGTSHGRLH
jgi:hypothetical protein